MSFRIRRVRADEGAAVRDLRLEAVQDPAAPFAFLHSYEEESVRPDSFWADRARNAASGDRAAQFVAEQGGEWIGTVTVLRRALGDTDPHGRPVREPRGDVVGVYVRSDRRGAGVIDALLEAAGAWSAEQGDVELLLEVHADNARAQRAYRRSGFAETGLRFTGSIGAELEMVRRLARPGEERA